LACIFLKLRLKSIEALRIAYTLQRKLVAEVHWGAKDCVHITEKIGLVLVYFRFRQWTDDNYWFKNRLINNCVGGNTIYVIIATLCLL